ncbi:MAG: hypothetical protein ACR2MG_08670 [Pyrinomonadaceae bacterium]
MREIEFKTGVIRPVECMKEGWELIKDQYWLFFGITFVGMLIAGVIPFGIGIGAMFCGIYFVLLQKMNGRQVEFGELFKGFEYFVPGLITSLIIIIPAIISVVILYGSMIAMFFASIDSRGNVNPAVIWGMFGTLFVEGVIISLVLGCLHALVMFAYPLIVDRKLNGFDAFKLSAKAVWANLSGVVGIILLEFVMGLIGYMAFGIGVYFVLPIMFAGVLIAYRKVFPPLNNQFTNQPPPPYSYQEAGNYR